MSTLSLPRKLVEIVRFAEITIDGSIAHIGDRIQLLERLHDHLADLLRGNFGFQPDDSSWRTIEFTTRSSRSASTGRLRKAICIERSILSAVERFALAITFHHGQLTKLHPLERGKPRTAAGAKRVGGE